MRVYSGPKFKGPDVDYLSWLLARRKYKDDTKIYIDTQDLNNAITYKELVDLTKRIGRGLREYEGIGAQGRGKDVVMVYSANQLMYPVSITSSICAGGIYSTCGASLIPKDAACQFQLVRPKVVICSEGLYEAAKATCKLCDIPLSKIYIMTSSPGKHDIYNAETGRSLIHPEPLEWERISDPSVLDSTTAVILFTSGTTGFPKYTAFVNLLISGAWNYLIAMWLQMLNKASFRDSLPKPIKIGKLILTFWKTIAEWLLYATLPFPMSVGLHGTLAGLSGGWCYVMPQWDPVALANCIAELPVTSIMTLPPIVHYLNHLNDPKVLRGLSKMDWLFVGAAPLAASLQRGFEAKIRAAGKDIGYESKLLIVNVWGMTELGAGGIAFRITLEPVITGVNGYPWPGCDCRLVDDDGNNVDYDTPGELLFRGANVMKGYFENPEATANSVRDGWFYTGDVAIGSKEGHITVLDRKKELIKYEGHQIAPGTPFSATVVTVAQMEALLNDHPHILDSAVFGLPDDKETGNDIPAAYVVRKNPSLTIDEVKQYVIENASDFKRLRGGVWFVDSIQKSVTGKIMRKEIREHALSTHVVSAPSMARI